MGLIQFSEDISWKEAELKRMLLFIRKYDSKKIKEQAEMSILKELASIQEEKEMHKRNWNILNRH